jgi:hypothetical protein
MLPYFIIGPGRIKNQSSKGKLGKILEGKSFSISLLVVLTLLLIFGSVMGDPEVYRRLFWNDRSVHIMTFDLAVMTVLLPIAVIFDQRNGRPVRRRILFFFISIPLMGPAMYLVFRSFKSRRN